MRQIQHYQFDARHCAFFETQSRTTFRVGRGRLWATIEGEDEDHWLAAGDALDVGARQRVWLSAEVADTRLDVATERPVPRPLSAILREAARYLRQHVDGRRRNATRRLNPGA